MALAFAQGPLTQRAAGVGMFPVARAGARLLAGTVSGVVLAIVLVPVLPPSIVLLVAAVCAVLTAGWGLSQDLKRQTLFATRSWCCSVRAGALSREWSSALSDWRGRSWPRCSRSALLPTSTGSRGTGSRPSDRRPETQHRPAPRPSAFAPDGIHADVWVRKMVQLVPGEGQVRR